MAEQELGNVAAATSAANPEVREGNEQYDPAKDPKRRAKSKDPGWQYGFWPDLGNKDKVQCKLCGVIVSSGIKKLKQHLAGGFGDVEKCSKTTTAIMREMHDYLKSSARNKPINYDEDEVEEGQQEQVAQDVEEVEVEQPQGTSTVQSSKGS